MFTTAQRFATIVTIGLIALAICVPPYKQVNGFVGGGQHIKFAGFAPFTNPPPAPGGRGGPVSVFWTVLGCEVAVIAAVGGGVTWSLRRPPSCI